MTNKFSCFLTQKGRWLTATLFLLFSLGIGQMWGTTGDPVSYIPSAFKGYSNTRYIVKETGTSIGTVYYAAHASASEVTLSEGKSYRYRQGAFLINVPAYSKIEIVYAGTSARKVLVGLYEVTDATTLLVWQRAAGYSGHVAAWLNAKANTEKAADGETTMYDYFRGKGVATSSGKISSNSSVYNDFIPNNSSLSISWGTNSSKFYTEIWKSEEVDVPANGTATINVNDGAVPAGNYLLSVGDNNSNVGIKEIIITPVYQLTWALDGGTITSAENAYTKAGYYTKGTAITAPTVTKSEADFAGWSPVVAATMPAAATTYTATWTTVCTAGVPGDVSKGALTAGKITLTAEGSAASGDTWYWQTSEYGVDKSNAGSTYEASSAGTYYVRSYKTSANCWNATAKSITLTAEDFLAKYAITYDKGANGTGTIAAGEKSEGIDFTLSSEMFTRDGYLQVGWATTEGTSRSYMIGGTYSTDAAQAFYPAWGEKDTYTFAATNAKTIAALEEEGWTFNSATFDADPADGECYVNTVGAMNTAGLTAPHNNGMNDNAIAFAKNTSAYALFDLGYVTTVSAVTGNFHIGSSSDRKFYIEYIGSDGTTVLKTVTVNHNNSNWTNANVVNETEVVPNVRYIKIKSVAEKSWLVMASFSVTYGSLIPKYDLTFAKGHEDATGTMSTLRYASGVEVTLPDCGFGAPAANKEFDTWVVTKTASSASVTVTDGKFTMPAEAVTATASWKDKVVKYAITEGTHTNGNITIDPAEQEAGETVTLAATPNEDYVFSAWDVYKTGNTETKVSVTSNTFTMPAYGVTVNATFVADPRAKVLYISTASTENDKVYEALKDIYNVKVVNDPASTIDQTAYALVVLHESVGGGSNNATAVANAKTGTTPVLNTKSYFYNNANTDNQRWNWGTPNAGKKTAGVHVNRAYCNITDHPLFADLTPDANDSIIILSAINSDNKPIQPIGTFTTGKEGYTLANVPDGCAIHELTPTQRGASSGKYLLISLYSKDFANLNANGQKLFQNAAAYLVGNTAWDPKTPKAVTHTLSNVTTTSATAVCAGVAYEATYAAASGFSLPATITVKVGSSTIDGANYTWNQATGALTIPASQVTDDIEVVVNGVFNCPAAGSGDVVFSWTPKSGSVSTEYIAAGGVDLAPYMESVVGGSITGYAQDINATTTTLYKNTNNHIYFNGDNAYIKVDLCELAEGDKILVENQDKNLWVSTSATRPANAEAAAAVLEPGKAFYIPNASALIGLSTIYIFREASFTEVASLTITRSKKFTVTYASPTLTEGTVPAAVDVFDGQKIIVAGQGTMVKGADHFAGWKDADNNEYTEGDELTVTADMTLTAQWVSCTPLTLAMSGYETTLTAGGATTTVTLDKGASTGTVTWESSNATILSVEDGVITPLKGGTATVTAHVAEDATYCANDITSDEITVNCVVTYNANGGEGTMADGSGTTVTIAANGFTYDSHKFLRWNTQPDGLGDNVAVGATVNENKTLYAIWKEVTCTAGANIFSIEFTNTANVNMADGDDDKDMSSYATIVGGSALMSYFRSGSNANVLTYGSSTSKASFGTNAQYLQLNLDCALQKGDVITIANESGNKTAIASGLAADKYPLNGTKESTSSTNSYTVLENDNIENADVLYIGRNTSSGSLTFTAITIYRPLPDASVPTIDASTPADASYAAADPISAMTVTADAVAPKDLHYQWYKEAGETDIEVGTDAASYTPTASGEYYCVVTNSPSGYTPKSATSRTATITLISSDATLAWIKAGDVNIALTTDVYDYEYTLPYDYAAATAPVVTVGTTDANANADVSQATSKTGTANIHVLAQDNTTYKDYSVKFKEFSGCARAFWFAYADDAATNSVTNNSTIFVSCPTGSSNTGTYTLTIGTDVYTATKNGGSFAESARLVIPSGFNATFYAKVRGSGSNKKITLISTADETVKYSSETFSSSDDAQVSIENIPAGTYKLTSDGLSRMYVMAVEMCKYPMEGVSLPATESVLVGQTVTLTPVFAPTNASNKNVTWESDAPSVATVANGVVTGVAAGTANITVTTEDGNFHATCAVTVTELDCDTYVGNLFALTIKDEEAASVSVNTEEINMSTYATIENGTAFVARTDGSASHKIAINQSSVIQMQYNTDKLYLKLNLQNCALRAGDMITITGTDDNEFSFTTDATRTTTYKTAGHKYMVQYSDALVGASTIYVWRADNSNTYLKSISIDRGTSIRNLTPGRMGTFTTAYDVKYFAGADFYVPNQIYSIGIEFIEVKELKAGYPYLIVANGDKLFVANEGDAVAEAEDDLQKTRGMVGYLGAGSVDVPNGEDYVVVKNNHLYTAYNNTMKAGYAYFDMTVIRNLTPMDANNSNGAPRRRLTVSYDAPAVTTDINNLEASETPVKLMINGQLFILRGEKLYDATGRLVK